MQSRTSEPSAAAPACAPRPLRRLSLLFLALSAAAVGAFGSVRLHGQSHGFASVRSRGPGRGAHPPPMLRRDRRESNRCPRRPCGADASRAFSTARGSAISDDATTVPAPTRPLSVADIEHTRQAARIARIGFGNTFPNPAVGCVLVRHGDGASPTDAVIGSGFHPRAGMPHAEVFALLEACGHVEDGVTAARSVMGTSGDDETLGERVMDLLADYKTDGGASELFGGRFDGWDVTAYVTLEPCCHWGQTPPCAASLAAAGVNRVVVGRRDPNPRVDGGGVRVLREAGVDVLLLADAKDVPDEEAEAAKECRDLVECFVKRISPREGPEEDLDNVVDGAKRRALRSIAGRQKMEGVMQQISWPEDNSITSHEKKSDEFAEAVPLDHRYLEDVDRALWDHELVLLRLKGAVQKKRGAKVLGRRIAEALDAHVAQVIGHTALLYRPGLPPVLDLDELAMAHADDSDQAL